MKRFPKAQTERSKGSPPLPLSVFTLPHCRQSCSCSRRFPQSFLILRLSGELILPALKFYTGSAGRTEISRHWHDDCVKSQLPAVFLKADRPVMGIKRSYVFFHFFISIRKSSPCSFTWAYSPDEPQNAKHFLLLSRCPPGSHMPLLWKPWRFWSGSQVPDRTVLWHLFFHSLFSSPMHLIFLLYLTLPQQQPLRSR